MALEPRAKVILEMITQSGASPKGCVNFDPPSLRTGTRSFSETCKSALKRSERPNGEGDIVMMDDFCYREPQPYWLKGILDKQDKTAFDPASSVASQGHCYSTTAPRAEDNGPDSTRRRIGHTLRAVLIMRTKIVISGQPIKVYSLDSRTVGFQAAWSRRGSLMKKPALEGN